MKKLLAALGAITSVVAGTSNIVSCGSKVNKSDLEPKTENQIENGIISLNNMKVFLPPSSKNVGEVVDLLLSTAREKLKKYKFKEGTNFDQSILTLDAGDVKYQGVPLKDEHLADADVIRDGKINVQVQYRYNNVACSVIEAKIKIKELSSKEICDKISSSHYEMRVALGSDVEQFREKINADFIKSKLGAYSSSFKPEVFRFIKVMINNVDISNDNLATVGNINSVIVYTYDDHVERKCDLKIVVEASQ